MFPQENGPLEIESIGVDIEATLENLRHRGKKPIKYEKAVAFAGSLLRRRHLECSDVTMEEVYLFHTIEVASYFGR